MRSVFILLRDTIEAEVAAHLNQTYGRSSYPKPSWVLRRGEETFLYIHFYRARALESEPDEYVDLVRRFGGEPAIEIMADVTGRHPGDEQVFEFVTDLLGRFSGAAMDDFSEHLWTLAELRAEHQVSGHRFFDYQGWYDDRKHQP